MICVLVAACLLAPTAEAAGGASVQIDKVPGQIYDVDASRILFKQSADAFGVKDRATGDVTSIPVALDQDPNGGYLTSRGAIVVTRQPSIPYKFFIGEHRDGPPPEDIDLGELNSGVDVAGDYAIWSNGTTLYRRTISTGTQITISTTANNWGNDVTPTGEVAYGSVGANNSDYDVHRYRFPLDETVGPAPADNSHTEVLPLTDGTNVVWAEHAADCCRGPDTLHGYGPTGAFDIANTDGGDGLLRDSDYKVAGGWVAFTRGRLVPVGHCCQIELATVWLRSPEGVETQVSDEAQYRLLALAPDGEVVYGDIYTDRFFVGRPGEDPVEITSPPATLHYAGPSEHGNGVFKLGGNWDAALDDSLYRLSLDEAHHDGSRTQITGGPQGDGNASHATFSFGSDGHPDATFECNLDGAGYEPCASPATFTSLQHGQHALAVRSVTSGEGADPDPAIAAWIVESDPPAPTITNPADGALTNDRTPTVGGAAGDAAEDSTTVTLKVYAGPSNVGWPLVRTISATRSGGTWSADVTPALDDGTYTVEATQSDAAGNVGTSAARTFRVDATPPEPTLSYTPTTVVTGQEVTFQAPFAGEVDGTAHWQWDLDGDGTFERDTGAQVYTTTRYSDAGDVHPAVRVVDKAGNAGVDRITLRVFPAPPPGLPGVTINDGDQFTNDPDVLVSPVWTPGSANVILSNDGGFAHAVTKPVARTVTWRLDSSGPERLPKTIYARFSPDGPTYQDDIILDETPPAVTSAEITGVGPQASAAAVTPQRIRSYHLHVKAHDATAGVSRMQVTSNRRHPGKIRRFRNRVDFRSSTAKIFVRVRDRARNWSHWKRFET